MWGFVIAIIFSALLCSCTKNWEISDSGLSKEMPAATTNGKSLPADNRLDIQKPIKEMSHQEFIDFIGNNACDEMRKTGVPVSVTVAQAIQETGWGKSTIEDAKNLFGVKGVGPAGSIEAQTQECATSGNCFKTTGKFKKYNTFQESIADHSKVFSLPYYKEAMKYTNDPDEFARKITGIYASDPNYGNHLISIMKSNNLYAFDSKCSQ